MRAFFFLFLTNMAVMVTLSVILTLTGAGNYITAQGINLSALAAFCLVWGFGGSFISLMISRWMAKRMYSLQMVTNLGGGPFAPQVNDWLYQTVRQLAERANIPMPELGVYQGSPNAFATGPSKSRALVAVSTGLIENLSEQEIVAVLAHEIAHIKNGDMVTMSLVQGCLNAFSMFLSRVLAYAVEAAVNKGESRSDGLRMGLTFAFDLLFSFLGFIVVSYVSRAREYRADAGAALLMGNIQPMVLALKRLDGKTEPLADGLKTLGIGGESSSSMTDLLRSHPTIEKRVAALQKGTYLKVAF